ncbi:MAG TPA: hypothetical protein VMD28_10750 [Acidimicrobiales bacterium]|nr:hypothetical protein [Acidimicrobiales bacterium]
MADGRETGAGAGSGTSEPGEAGEPGEPGEERGALTLQNAAVLLGAYCWVERRLFELTGSWASAPGLGDGARLFLFEASGQHAWHAELWEARLPVLAGVDREGLARPLGPAVETLLEGLAPGSVGGDRETAGRRFLVGLARVVLPLLIVSYRRFGRLLVPVADGPAIRTLRLVAQDVEGELRVAEAVVDALLDGPEVAQEAAEWTRALSEPVLRGGPDDDLLAWSEGEFVR